MRAWVVAAWWVAACGATPPAERALSPQDPETQGPEAQRSEAQRSEADVPASEEHAARGRVAAGCAIHEGQVFCWDRSEDGQRGNGRRELEAETTRVSEIADAVEVERSASYACARRLDGTVACWGRLPWGARTWSQDSTRDAEEVELTPVPVPGLEGIVDIAAAQRTFCAATERGAVHCLGDGFAGELGDGERRRAFEAFRVPGVTEATQVGVGDGLGCALRRGGDIVCWGTRARRVVAEELPYERHPAREATALPRNASELSVSNEAVCVRTEEGITCRAEHDSLRVSNVVEGSIRVAVGASVACALNAQKQVWCWGLNIAEPEQISLPGAVVDIAVHGASACALLEDESVQCWGPRHYGGALQVVGVGPSVSVSGGCAALRAGGVHCWRQDGAQAQATLESALSSPSARARWIHVGTNICVLEDQTLRCRQRPGFGQRLEFDERRVEQVSVGGSGGCFVSGGRVHCWRHDRPPRTVPRTAGASYVHVEDGRACAILRSGVRCWTTSDSAPSDLRPFTIREFAGAQSLSFDSVQARSHFPFRTLCVVGADQRVACRYWEFRTGRHEPFEVTIPGTREVVVAYERVWVTREDEPIVEVDLRETPIGGHRERPRGVRGEVPNSRGLRGLEITTTANCALDEEGQVWCWGYDGGQGGVTGRTGPSLAFRPPSAR
ncbi:MAG: hypothetical protein AAGE52_16830 [Myxococcota bacterium]